MNQVLSGVLKDIGKLDEVLGDLWEAKRGRQTIKNGLVRERGEQEAKKFAAGQDLVLRMLQGRKSGEGRGSLGEDIMPTQRSRLNVSDGIHIIGSAIRESESARFTLVEKRLALEREKMERHGKARKAEREACTEELCAYRATMDCVISQNSEKMKTVLGPLEALVEKRRAD